MINAVLKQFLHIKRLPGDSEVITYIKSSKASGYLLPRLDFIIRSHPQDTVGRHCRNPMGSAGFLI